MERRVSRKTNSRARVEALGVDGCGKLSCSQPWLSAVCRCVWGPQKEYTHTQTHTHRCIYIHSHIHTYIHTPTCWARGLKQFRLSWKGNWFYLKPFPLNVLYMPGTTVIKKSEWIPLHTIRKTFKAWEEDCVDCLTLCFWTTFSPPFFSFRSWKAKFLIS